MSGRDQTLFHSQPYIRGSSPLLASSGNVANATAAAVLTPAAGQAVVLYGFIVTASGVTTAAAVTLTVAGLIGGTISFTYVGLAGVLLAGPTLLFEPKIPLLGTVGQAITVSLPALGSGNTNATVTAWGYSA